MSCFKRIVKNVWFIVVVGCLLSLLLSQVMNLRETVVTPRCVNQTAPDGEREISYLKCK